MSIMKRRMSKVPAVGDLVTCDGETCIVLNISDETEHAADEITHIGRDVASSQKISVYNFITCEDETILLLKYSKGRPRYEFINVDTESQVEVHKLGGAS